MYELIMERDERQRLRCRGWLSPACWDVAGVCTSFAGDGGFGGGTWGQGSDQWGASQPKHPHARNPAAIHGPSASPVPDGAWSVGGLKRQPQGEPAGSQ